MSFFMSYSRGLECGNAARALLLVTGAGRKRNQLSRRLRCNSNYHNALAVEGGVGGG